jgi:hypothetical protein
MQTPTAEETQFLIALHCGAGFHAPKLEAQYKRGNMCCTSSDITSHANLLLSELRQLDMDDQAISKVSEPLWSGVSVSNPGLST